ncbi:hypothetical protein FHS29_000955 [Saccharothrix tamanrassetensis]|uniref:Uncharacterized protein n=1 Tax=Saccharothrix tamanrassetensis TaxID=1051531 RepID=A0A841CEE0_9PSEU|nr:hypothetical protein [Saccharothrix tamanrassetensis]
MLLVARAEQGFAVVVAKQEREPGQVGAELADDHLVHAGRALLPLGDDLTICGSNPALRSRGTSISTGPTS